MFHIANQPWLCNTNSNQSLQSLFVAKIAQIIIVILSPLLAIVQKNWKRTLVRIGKDSCTQQTNLFHNTKLKVLLIMSYGWIFLTMVWPIGHDGFRSDRLFTLCDSCHFPNSSSGPGFNTTTANCFRTSFPLCIPIYSHRSHSMNSMKVTILLWPKTTISPSTAFVSTPCGVISTAGGRRGCRIKCIMDIIVISIFASSLHEQTGSFDKFVHWHCGSGISCCRVLPLVQTKNCNFLLLKNLCTHVSSWHKKETTATIIFNFFLTSYFLCLVS